MKTSFFPALCIGSAHDFFAKKVLLRMGPGLRRSSRKHSCTHMLGWMGSGLDRYCRIAARRLILPLRKQF